MWGSNPSAPPIRPERFDLERQRRLISQPFGSPNERLAGFTPQRNRPGMPTNTAPIPRIRYGFGTRPPRRYGF